MCVPNDFISLECFLFLSWADVYIGPWFWSFRYNLYYPILNVTLSG